MTPTVAPERVETALPEATVDELLAMLDGEPACMVGAVILEHGLSVGCSKPARWVTRLHCGHPFVSCDDHLGDMTLDGGAVFCGCGRPSCWVPPQFSGVGRQGFSVPRTGPPLVWLPL